MYLYWLFFCPRSRPGSGNYLYTNFQSGRIFRRKDVLPNAHINAIGTFTPTSRELTSDLVKNSQVFVDEYAAALKESGDLLIPISEGAFSAEKIVGSLGELVTGKVKLKAEQKGRTIFDAVGLAVEDLCCAEYIYQKIQGEN